MAIYQGAWRIYQDSPEYGCDDNPSYEWFADESFNGHSTGRSHRAPTLEQIKADIANNTKES